MSLVPTAVLSVGAWRAWRHAGTWLEPGVFFAIVWAALTALALLVAYDVEVWPSALAWILLAGAAVWFGSWAGRQFGQIGQHEPDPPATEGAADSGPWPGLELGIVLASLAGLASVLLILGTRGKGFEIFLSLKSIMRTAREYSTARYIGGFTDPAPARVLLTGNYVGALLAGMLLAQRPWRRRQLVAALPLVPAMALALVETEKSAIAFVLITIAASYLAFRIAFTRSGERVLNARLVLGLAGGAVLLWILALGIQMARYGYTNPARLPFVQDRLRLFIFGYLGGFSYWLQHANLFAVKPAWGVFTLGGIFDLTGIRHRPPGLYTDVIKIGASQTPTNIYTIHRGLIEDFGVAGALLALTLVGGIAGFAFARVRRGQVSWAPALSAFYALTLWSFTVSLFLYNTMIMSWLLFGAYLWLARTRFGRSLPVIVERARTAVARAVPP